MGGWDVHAHLAPPADGLPPEIGDADALLARLDAGRLDGAVVSPPPPLFGTEGLNDAVAELASRDPARLRPLRYLPIERPEEAAAEAGDAVIATSAGERTLADAELDPLWAALDERSAFVFIHPVDAPDRRLRRFYLGNLLGFPYETAMAAACLVFADVPARFPRIRFCLAHAGGATAALAGRWQRGYETGRPGIPRLALEPREALRRLAVDSVAHSEDVLALARVTFAEVLPGTDWPFSLGVSA